MCRWGCETTDTTYMCKWCGTRYCKSCLRGEFGTGTMKDGNWCFQCNQKKCTGKRVEYIPPTPNNGDNSTDKKSKSSKSNKSVKSKPTKSKRNAKSKKAKRKK